MPGIAEFLADGPFKLIIAELPGGDIMLTQGQHDHPRATFDHDAATPCPRGGEYAAFRGSPGGLMAPIIVLGQPQPCRSYR